MIENHGTVVDDSTTPTRFILGGKGFSNRPLMDYSCPVTRGKLARRRSAFLLKFVKDVLDGIPPGPYSPFGDERVTIGKLAWAAAVASSRAFRFDERLQLVGGVATAEGDPVIVPFIDMVNVNVEDGEGVNVKVLLVLLFNFLC